MDDFIELRRVFSGILRFWWLLILLAALGAAVGYLLSQRQRPVYQATTTLLVGQIFQETNLNRQDILTSDLVASTYSDMIRRQPILQGVVDTLGLSQSWQQLRSRVSVELVQGTQLIQISVEDYSPQSAQIIADEIVHQMILFNPAESSTEESQSARLFVRQHVEDLQTRIADGQSELASLEREIANTESQERLVQLQAQENTLTSLITDWESTYTQLLGYLSTGQSPNTLTVIEPAQASPNPVRPLVQLFILIGGVIGAFIGLAIIFFLNYLDNTLRQADEINRRYGLPVIGSIGNMPSYKMRKKGVLVSIHPRSPIAEAYRTLRANLEFTDPNQPLKTILITSCDTNEGKTSVAINLAAILAQNSKKVTLLDADLRKPGIHELTALPNKTGLSDIVRNEKDISQAKQFLKTENVDVITSGPVPPNPAELLGSKRMGELLNELEQDNDMVIIDSPPFVVSDSLLLAAKVDGVLLVVRPGFTRRDMFQSVLEQLERAEARVAGVVMNRVPIKKGLHYRAYQYKSVESEPKKQKPVMQKIRAFVSK